VILTEPGLA
jgi:hypothetical protein